MLKDEIDKLITSYIKQSSDGLEIENPKFDFKEKWYDLSSKPGVNEFLKDTSAIANTFGLDGFIVIGYNNKTNTFHDTKFSDSKLSDTSKITDLINKKIDRLFELAIYNTIIEKHSLSVIHIPPSIDKPHVITNYQTFEKSGIIKKEEAQRIFVRKGTSTFPASKYDIELMFYDRKNIIPDYRILTSYHPYSLDINIPGPVMAGVKRIDGLISSISLSFENLGRRPVAITELNLQLTILDDPRDHNKIDFVSAFELKSANIVIQPNELKNQVVDFKCLELPSKQIESLTHLTNNILGHKELIKAKHITLKLSNGTIIQSELTQATL